MNEPEFWCPNSNEQWAPAGWIDPRGQGTAPVTSVGLAALTLEARPLS